MANMENLKEVPGFPGYCINGIGEVFSIKTNIILKPWKISGYYAIGLYKNGKRYVFLIHRLVSTVFIPNIDDKPQVDHINGILTDNRIENLRWATPKENSNNPITIEKLKCVLNNKPHYAAKSLAQYDLKGNLIKTYVSFAEAKKNGFLRKGICKNLEGKTKNYNGYLWEQL